MIVMRARARSPKLAGEAVGAAGDSEGGGGA